MQLLDSSYLGLRSARLTFRSVSSNVTVTLFPMIHLGEAAFYEAVYRDACAHDAVLVEGDYRWFGSRTSLAKGHALDDLPSRDETLRWTPEYASLDDAILSERDNRLVEVMSEYLDSTSTKARRLAIVYGARHMRAVIKELTRRQSFRCADSEWMLIFPLEQESPLVPDPGAA